MSFSVRRILQAIRTGGLSERRPRDPMPKGLRQEDLEELRQQKARLTEARRQGKIGKGRLYD